MTVVFSSRREWTTLILGSAVLCACFGLGFVAFLPKPPQPVDRISEYFIGPWRSAAFGIAWASCAAVALTILDALAGLKRQRTGAEQISSEGQSIQETLEQVQAVLDDCMSPRNLDIGQALDVLLRGAMVLRASDVHLNPLTGGLKVTYRVDGVLYQVLSVEPEYSSRLSQRVKVLARLDTFSKEPQDGSLRRRIGDIEVEARVSVLPSNHGERVVLRLVRGGEAILPIGQLGFEPQITEQLQACLAKPQGLLFVSGPVGSGKTTTLYSALQHVNDTRGETTAIMTLEDPIELQLPFATQTQINAKVGMSFAQTLRSVLRQDPGALMVGEIRDRETAEIATQAGLTGHLILSTLHVQSAAGTFARLVEMDVEPFVLASSTIGSLAQRLVRGLCRECCVPVAPTDEERSRLAEVGIGLPEAQYYGAQGCPACEGRGYDRRIPIAELLIVTEAIMAAVREKQPSEQIRKIAMTEGMVPLAAQGVILAARGETSLSEVLRVAG